MTQDRKNRLQGVIHVVDDDASVRTALARLLGAVGYEVRTHDSPASYLLEPQSDSASCLILDVRMPQVSGLEMQDALAKLRIPVPIIFLTGHGDIPMSVRAMKAGAVDFLAKPVPGHVLITAIDQAIARGEEERAVRAHRRETKALYDRLTAREREVFAHLISGQLNKEVAFDLGTAERTVKAHRHSILGKLGAQSIADLCRIATELQIAPVRGSA